MEHQAKASGSRQRKRLGREGLAKTSGDASPVILNSLHTDSVLVNIYQYDTLMHQGREAGSDAKSQGGRV